MRPLIGSRDIVPGWGGGGEQPPFFPFSLPALLFAAREQQGGFESFIFLFSRGFGGGAPIACPCLGLKAVKRIQSHGLRPWEGEWEEPARITPASLA